MSARKFFLFFLCFCFSIRSIAQTGVSITGQVTDQNNQPIEFANVLLIKTADSSQVKAVVTDKKGKFTIAAVMPAAYVLRCSYIGSQPELSQPFTITDGQRVYRVETIVLAAVTKQLDNVTVSGKKSTLNTSIDRKVYNVDQDIMSKSGSVSDILKNIPSVEVDIEGQVSLRGSADVMILINGKPSPLMGKTRAEVLQQLPANSIERIEVITNPSARYRPDGTSGIINIVLKKNI
ncbi:MAG: TonB-dependent receptor, partial [Chitinophagaceae bacterium]|nr:TonB-dependent receptor [Chitinophagaceae bacterium]